MKILYGTDPECFIKNVKSGQFVSAEGLIPGTKKRPYKVDGGAIQVDGLAGEFNIDPAATLAEFTKNINKVKAQLLEMVQAVDKDLTLDFVPIAEFDQAYFDTLPPFQKILGCDPDFNVKGEINHSPANGSLPVRTAAGHIHIGWTEGKGKGDQVHFNDCLHVAAHFHANGLESFIAHARQNERLIFYGHTGSFRNKPYGVELRSPDNTWVSTDENIEKMWNFVNYHMSQLGA